MTMNGTPTMPPVSRCELPECGAAIERGKLMCLDHWRMVPRSIQVEVGRTWRGVCRAGLKQRLAALKSYRRAVDQAVSAARGSLP